VLRVGLTGGTAVGKSTVMKLLAAKPHVHVVDADQIVHELYRPGTEFARRIAEELGAQALAPDGSVDRARVASLVFSDTAKLKKLEAIVHPAVIAEEKRMTDAIAARDPHAIAIVEATKMLEAGTHADYDVVLLVTARPEVQRLRFAGRTPHLSAEDSAGELQRRLSAQFTDEQRRALVPPQFIIDNSGTLEETAAQVERIYAALCAASDSI